MSQVLKKCGVQLRTVNRIHLALLMWSFAKDRFPPSQFIQTCFHIVYILLPGGLSFVSTAVWTDMKTFIHLFLLFFFLCTDLCEVFLIVRICSYFDSPFISWAMYCKFLKLRNVSIWLFIFLCTFLHLCLKDILCVSVCSHMFKYMPMCNCVWCSKGIYVICC